MGIEVMLTSSSDLDAVASFLARVFRITRSASFVNRELLRWKYFEPGPEWPETRSYILKKGNEIYAHCGVVPVNSRVSGQQISGIYPIDWAGDGRLPGSGVLIMKNLLKRAETAIVVGGSNDTRAILPRIGFASAGEVTNFARVVRPWKQLRARPSENLGKQAGRLLRNTAWSRSPIGKIPSGWSAREVESFENTSEHSFDLDHPLPSRPYQYLNYWLRCPAASMSGFKILLEGREVGHFLLSRVGGQTRIADARLVSTNISDWTTAYRLAAEVATEDAETCEILASATTPISFQSLEKCGFRNRGSVPFFLHDPAGRFADHPKMFWNMIDGDAAYIKDPAFPFVT